MAFSKLIIFLFYSMINSQPCLFKDKISNLCFVCSPDFYRSDEGKSSTPFQENICVKKIEDCSERKILIRSSTGDCQICAKYFDFVYDNFFDAFIFESMLLRPFYRPTLIMYAEAGEHFLTENQGSEEMNHIFRSQLANITILPVFCSDFPDFKLLISCIYSKEQTKVYVKTTKILLFVSYMLRIVNISFVGTDLRVRDFSLECLTKKGVSCCGGQINEPSDCLSPSYFLNFPNRPLGFINLEHYQFGSAPELSLESCEFKDFIVGFEGPSSILRVLSGSPFKITWNETNLINSALKDGIMNCEKDQYYAVQYNEFFFVNTTALRNKSFLIVRNSYFSGTLKKSIIVAINLNQYLFLLSGYNFSLIEFSNITFERQDVFRNANRRAIFLIDINGGSLNSFELNKITLLTSAIEFFIVLSCPSKILIVSFLLINSSFSKNPIFYTYSANLEINSIFVKNSAADFSTSAYLVWAESSELKIMSMAYELSGFSLAFIKCNATLHNSSISGEYSQFSPYLIQTQKGILEVSNSSFIGIRLLLNGAVMISAFESSNILFKNNFISLISCFTMFDLQKIGSIEFTFSNLTDINSVFTIFSEQCNFAIFKISDTNFFSNKFNHFFLILNPELFSSPAPLLDIIRLRFRDQLMNSTISAFFSAFSNIIMRITSSRFENMRRLKHLISPPIAIFFLTRGSSLDIYNTSFINVGYAYEPTQMNVLYNYPLFFTTYTIYINVSHSYFSIDETISLQGFLLNAGVLTYVFLRKNTFESHNPQPNYAYRAYISLENPLTYLVENTFSKMRCYSRDYYSDFLGKGSIYISGFTSFYVGNNKAYLINSYFKDCKCSQGGALILRFLFESYVMGNVFEGNRAILGGSIFLQEIKNAYFSNNIVYNSFATISGLIHTDTIENFTTVNCSFFNSFADQGSAIYLNKVSIHLIESSIFYCVTNSMTQGAFLIEYSSLIMNDSTCASFASSDIGGLFFLDLSSNLTLNNSKVINCTAYYGGVGFVNLGINIVISSSIFQHVESAMSGGVFYFDLISKVIFFSNSFLDCSSSTGGVIFIKTSDENAEFLIKNSIFHSVEANIGSCLYFNSPSGLSLINITLVNAKGNAIYLKWEFLIHIQLINISIELSSTEGSLCFAYGVSIYFRDLVLKNNVVGRKLIWFQSSVISGENIILTDNLVKDKSSKPHSVQLERSKFYVNKFLYSLLINVETYQGAISSNLQSQAIIINSVFLGGWVVGIVYSENSQVRIESSKFSHGKGSALFSFETDLSIYQGSFVMMVSLSEEIASAIYVDTREDSFNSLGLDQIYIEGNTSSGSAIYLKGVEEISIQNTCIKNTQQGIRVLSVIRIKFLSCIFENISGHFHGSAISIINNINKGSMSIIDSNFLKCISYKMAGAVYAFYVEKVDILKAFFKENEALGDLGRGASGVLICEEGKSSNCSITINNSVFLNNYASFIAPLFISNRVFQYYQITSEGNKDGNNFTDKMSFFPVNVFVTNAESLNIISEGQNHASLTRPFLWGIFNENALNITSGQPFSLHITLFDNLNQTLLFEDSASISLNIPISNNNHLFLNPCIAQSRKGNLNLENCILKGPPNSFNLIEISIKISAESILSRNEQILKQTLRIFLRPCTRDEILRYDYSCQFCAQTKFADPSQPDKCSECPKNAICPGGWRVFPVAGYWRAGNTNNFAQCFIGDACLGYIHEKSDSENYRGNCLQGHYGLLCNDCENGFGKSNSLSVCKPCGDVIDYLRLSGGVFFIFIYILGVSYSYSLEVKSKNYYNQLLTYSKIIFSFMQVTNMLIFFKFSWVLPTFQQIISITNNIFITTEDILLNDCLFKKSSIALDERYAHKVLVIIFLPLIFFVLTAGFWSINFILKQYRNKFSGKNLKKLKKVFVVRNLASLITAIFLFHPLITKACFNLFNCVLLDGTSGYSTYLFIYPNFECWTNFHFKIVGAVAVPGVFFWGVCFPFVLLMLLLKQKSMEAKVIADNFNLATMSKQSEDPEFLSRILAKPIIKTSFSISLSFRPKKSLKHKKKSKSLTIVMIKSQILDFLYIGYKPEFLYWECLIFLKKFLISILINLQYLFGMNLIALLVVLVQGVHLRFQLSVNPYLLEKMNQLESSSIVISTLIFATAIILTLDLENQTQLAFNITIILAYLGFLAQSLWAVGLLLRQSRLLCIWLNHISKRLKSRESSGGFS